MIHTRDVVSGLLVLAVAVWFARTTSVGGGRPTLVVAIAGCTLAGVAYLAAAVINTAQHSIAGVKMSHERARGIATVSLGIAIFALGVDGLFAGLDALSAVLIAGGSLAVVAGWLRVRRGRPARSGPDTGEQ
jgi:hypothetical protein